MIPPVELEMLAVAPAGSRQRACGEFGATPGVDELESPTAQCES